MRLTTYITRLVVTWAQKWHQKQARDYSCDNNLLYLHSKIKPASDYKMENKILDHPSLNVKEQQSKVLARSSEPAEELHRERTFP